MIFKDRTQRSVNFQSERYGLIFRFQFQFWLDDESWQSIYGSCFIEQNGVSDALSTYVKYDRSSENISVTFRDLREYKKDQKAIQRIMDIMTPKIKKIFNENKEDFKKVIYYEN